MNKNMSFETAMNQLNEIVVKLESGETSLDESLKLFEKGTSSGIFRDKLTKQSRKITRNDCFGNKVVELQKGRR